MKINRLMVWSALGIMGGLPGCSQQVIQTQLQATPQNALAYVKNHQPLVTQAKQQRLSQLYLAHYFSPWTDDQRNFTDQEVLQAEQEFIAQFTKKPGYGENQQPLDSNWINGLAANMHLDNFPNRRFRAITLHPTDLRLLPTAAPTFSALKPVWENYPFDNLQNNYLPANIPVLALHTTQDHAWTLVLVHNDVGWIRTENIAPVDANFIKHWQQKSQILATRENFPVTDDQQRYYFQTRLGVLYPLISETNDNFIIAIATSDDEGQAVIKSAKLAKTNASYFPLPMTETNMAQLINTQLGMPYGWGGLYGFRDCSSFLADIYAAFGIWLPRNSHDQALVGKIINLSNLTSDVKQKALLKQGKPFLTLIGLPGHIMLYIGDYQNRLYVANTLWGLRTKDIGGKQGRVVIGKAVIMPLDIDNGLFSSVSVLSRIDNIAVLDPTQLD